MAYVEIIKIQTGPTTQPALDTIRAAVAEQLDKELNSFKILKNRSIDNELMVILNWKRERQAPWGSPLAQRLVQEFRRLGLVDHSLWTEFPSLVGASRPG